MNAATLDRHVEQELEHLRDEFVGTIPAAQVSQVGTAWFNRLRTDARILDYIPVLVYRYAREELRNDRRVLEQATT